MAHYDSLTALPNRFLALDRLSQLIKKAKRKSSHVAVLFLDLDNFKKINDSLGHDTGDKLLVEAASRLRRVLRRGDTIGRLGGDEFIVLLNELASPQATGSVIENLLEQFRTPFISDGRELVLTASIGIAIYPNDGETSSELLRNADSAMFNAKDNGRNNYAYYTEDMNRIVSRRLEVEEQLHGALERYEFELYFQPQVCLKTGKIIGAEALLRWHNPVLGDVPPDEFIQVAEQIGSIVPIGQYIIRRTLEMTQQWQKSYREDFHVALNLSPAQFRDPNLVQFIRDKVTQSGIDPQTLTMEITEGVLLSGNALIDEALASLNELGVTISMDDFGTGYSSLSYLRRYPFDEIKIDRGFVNDITNDPDDRELICAMIMMAKGLNLKVVAEGVETAEQELFLQNESCDIGQGFRYGRPVSVDAFTALLQKNSAIA